MDLFELDPQAVEHLQAQGFNLLERANLIYAGFLFPECDNPPTLSWKELSIGVQMLLTDYTGRDFEVRLFLFKFSLTIVAT